MRFEIECPQCGHVLRLPTAAAGSIRACLNCGAKMSVPMLESAGAEIPFAEAVEPETPPEENKPITLPAVPPASPGQSAQDAERGVQEPLVDFAEMASGPADTVDAGQGNPFSSPRATSREFVEVGDEPIDFIPDLSDMPELEFAPRNSALALSHRQLRDALKYASTTRSAATFIFAMLLISLAIEVFIVIVTGIAIVRRVAPEANNAALLALGIHFVGGLLSGVMAALTREYSLRLGDFLTFKRADDLVESLASASRYWQSSGFIAGFVFGFSLLALLTVIAFY